MAHRNPDRIPITGRRGHCETVSQMIALGWDVMAQCRTCRIRTHVSLAVIAKVMGPDYSLWNRRAHCKAYGCTGFVEFLAKAPGMTFHQELKAPAPRTGR